MSRLCVEIAGVPFKNPVILASGCCGFGLEFEDFYPVERLGGLSLKGITPTRREGNDPCRVAETPAGMLNSVGLQNPGVEEFLKTALPALSGRDVVKIANVAGANVEEYAYMAERLAESDVDMLEVNISCPNVKAGGVAFGTSPECAGEVVREMRGRTKKPLMVKLSPNVTDIAEIARAVEAEGADAVSLINTLLGMRIDIKTRQPVLHNIVGGLSGPAVFPVALRMVWQTARAVKIPVVGLGGVSRWQDAVEMLLAGARAIQIGAALFSDPLTPLHVLEGLNAWLDDQGVQDVSEIIGALRV